MKVSSQILVSALTLASASAFVPSPSSSNTVKTELGMGLFDGFKAGGSGRDRLDEEWEKQQEILAMRRAPKAERDQYFKNIEKRREKAAEERERNWAWQTKTYKKGEDPIDEWRKRRQEGTISDLDEQYGDPKKIGGIPLPMPSFGVGGEFGVGGKYDNGGRFDLRLPYADQGYVDEDADFMGKLFGKKKKKEEPKAPEEPKKKKGGWPW